MKTIQLASLYLAQYPGLGAVVEWFFGHGGPLAHKEALQSRRVLRCSFSNSDRLPHSLGSHRYEFWT